MLLSTSQDAIASAVAATVIDQYAFYNASAFDQRRAQIEAADDSAIATDKVALRPGQTASFANYTSYSKGLNGIMVDVSGLASPESLTAADFEFRTGNIEDVTLWTLAPAPLDLQVRSLAAQPGTDRITLTWADNNLDGVVDPNEAVAKRWLQVVVKATANTGLAADYTFFFGNAPGESGDNPANATVDTTDELGARNNQHTFLNPAPIDDIYDYNRDARVDSSDELLARNHQTTFLTRLRLITTAAPPRPLQFSFELPNIASLSVDELTYLPAPGANGLIAEAEAASFQFRGALEGLNASAGPASVLLYDEDDDPLTAESFVLSGATVQAPSFDFTVNGQTLVSAVGLRVSVEQLSNRNSTIGGTISLLMDDATILPDEQGSSFSASAEYAGGEWNLATGAIALSALRSELSIGEAVEAVGIGATISIDPADPGADAVILSLGGATLSFPAYPDLPQVDVTGITIRRNGVSIDDFSADFDGGVVGAAQQLAEGAAQQSLADHLSSGSPARPLLIVPGIVGTFPVANNADDDAGYRKWLLRRGVHPNEMEPEQLTKVNDDLFQSLVNSGYTPDQDLFVVNYDWRVMPGPDDGSIDGVVSGLNSIELVDERFDYGVDYFGWFLDQAADAWAAAHGGQRPASVDVIAHSTGGLVTRSYIQSNVYGNSYVDADSGNIAHTLPKVNHFVSVGVPHRGASKAWGPLNDDFSVDPAFRFVLSKILNGPYQKLISHEVSEIRGPSGLFGAPDNITLEKIKPTETQTQIERFIDLYLPTGRALLATYPFLTDENANPVDINSDPALRNTLALDLNAGVDMGLAGDPNAFIDLMTGNFTAVAGWSESTPTFTETHVGKDTFLRFNPGRDILEQANPNPVVIAGMDAYGTRPANPGEVWYVVKKQAANGDGTVPLESSVGQFLGDLRANVVLFVGAESLKTAPVPSSPAPNAVIFRSLENPGHLPLMYLPETQASIFTALGRETPTLSTDQAIHGDLSNILGILTVDPVGAVLYRDNGQPLVGYDAQSDQVITSPGTYYIGGTDGLGVIFREALTDGEILSLGLEAVDGGGDYAVGVAQINGGVGVGEFTGSLSAGQVQTEPISFERIFSGRFGVEDLFEVEGLSISGSGLSVTFGQGLPQIAGTITLAADAAAILPDRGTEALDGLVTAIGFVGTIDLATAALTLQVQDEATLTIDGIVNATASGNATEPALRLNIDPADIDPEAILAELRGVTVSLPGVPELPQDVLTIDTLIVRRSGVDVVASVGGVDMVLGGLIDVQDLQVDVAVSLRMVQAAGLTLPQVSVGGSVEVTANQATLLPGGPLSLTVLNATGDGRPGFRGAVDFDTGQFSIEMLALQGALRVGGETLFSLEASEGPGGEPALAFLFDRSLGPDEAMLSLPQLTGIFDVLAITPPGESPSAPRVTIDGTAVQADGGVELDSIALSLPPRYANTSFGLAGAVPVELASLSVAFDELSDGSADFGTFSVVADAIVDTAGLQQQLGALLGTAPLVSVRRYDQQGNLTDLSGGGHIEFELRVENGQPKLINVPGLVVGLQDFTLSLPGNESLALGGTLTLPAIDADGLPQAIPSTLVPVDLAGAQVVLDLSAVADTSAGVLGGSIVVGGALTFQANGAMLLSLAGEAVIDGDLRFLGGSASGSLTADFSWDLASQPQSDGTIVFTGAPVIDGLLLEEIVLEVDGFARLTIASAQIDFDPPAGDAVATATDGTIEFLIDGLQGVGGTIGGIALYDDVGADGVIDGFSFVNAAIGNLGILTLGPDIGDGRTLIELLDSSLDIPELTYRNGSFTSGLPDILISAANVAVHLPGVSVAAAGLAVSLSPNQRVFQASASSLVLGVGDAFENGASLFKVTLLNPVLRLDDSDATDLLTIGQATLGFGPDAAPLDALVFSLAPTAANQDHALRLNLLPDGSGGFATHLGLGQVNLNAGGGGVLAALGLGGLLPLDVTDASLAFTQPDAQGYTDLRAFDLTVAGDFDFSVFGALPFTPQVTIGQIPLASGSSIGAQQSGADFNVSVAIDFTGGAPQPIVPIFQDVRLGLDGLELGGFTFGGEVAIAGYRLDATGTIVPLAYGVDISGNAVLVDSGDDADPATPGEQLGEQVRGSFFVEDSSGGSTVGGFDFDFKSLAVSLAGSIVREANQTNLHLLGDLDLNGTVGFGDFLTIDSFGLTSTLDWTLNDDFSAGDLSLTVDQARTRGISIGLGDFFKATAEGSEAGPDGQPGTADDGFVALNFSEDPNVPLLQDLDLTLSSPALGLYGSIGGFDILPGALPPFDQIDDVTIGIEDGSMLDTLQDWFLPIRSNALTVDFLQSFFDRDPQDGSIIGIADPAAVQLLIDGAVGIPGFIGDALGEVGLDAEVAFQQLSINIEQMRNLAAELLEWAGVLGGATFEQFVESSDRQTITTAFSAAFDQVQSQGLPFTIFELGETIDITQLNGLGLELGIELGDGFAVTGAISVGRADANGQTSSAIDDVYYLAISGAVKVSSYGGGGTLVLTTAGPVAATIEFGVPIPLGPTTLTLGGGGGIVFGKDLLDGVDTSQPTINPADIPTPLDWDLTDLPTIEGILTQLWDSQANQLTPVWNLPATLAINGKLTSIAVAGLVSLEGTIAASLPSLEAALAGEGLSFLGLGELKGFGMPFAAGGVLVDARDLLNPTVSFGFRVPPPSNPLGFLFPVQADLAGTLRTDGMIEAWLVGLQTLVQGAVDGANQPLHDLLDVVAANLETARLSGGANELAGLLGLSAATPVKPELITAAVLNQLTQLSATSAEDLARMTTALWTEFQLAAGRLDGFDFQSAIGDVFGGLLAGALSSSNQAIIDAYNAFNPSLVISGAIQPSLLGFPIGQPTDEVELIINKQQMTLDLHTTNVLASYPPLLILGISDRFEIGFTAKLPGGLIDVLIDPTASPDDIAAAFGDALNPFTGWEARLSGSVSLLGVELGKVSGIVFAPQETDAEGDPLPGTLFAENVYNFGFLDGKELTGDNTRLPVGHENDIPVYFDSRYRAMTQYGGLLLTGELNLPELLRDPVVVFNALTALTGQTADSLRGPWDALSDGNVDLTDLSNAQVVVEILQGYLDQVVALLTSQSPLGTLQLYIPSPATLVEGFLNYTLPAVVGAGDGSGERILLDRVPGEDAGGNPAFAPAMPYDPANPPLGAPLRFVDLNGNAFYNPRVDLLAIGAGGTPQVWSDHIPAGAGAGDLTLGAGDVAVSPGAISGLPQYVLNDVAEDLGNGVLDSASPAGFQAGRSLGFIDVNHNGWLDWSADPVTGAIAFHETLIDARSGAEVEAGALPDLAAFIDEAALAPGGAPDGYTPPSDTAAGDRILGLNEGFRDANGNGRFDLGTDVLYDLNGNGLPDGELFIDADGDGAHTQPEPYDDINGNGVRDVGDSLTEPFTDINGNGGFNTGDPFIDLGNGLYDPPAEPVFSFDDASQQAIDLFNSAYIDGFADVRLLGLDLGDGRIRADASGLFLDISSGPYGFDLTAGIGFNEFNAGEILAALTDGPLAQMGAQGLLEALLPASLRPRVDEFRAGLIDLAGNFAFPFPVASLDAGFDLAKVRSWLTESFGTAADHLFVFTDANGNPAPVDATTRVEFYSPLFNENPPPHPTADPTDPRHVVPSLKPLDDIQRYGGGRVSATLNLPNFIEGAVGIFEAQFPNSPDDLLAPDFAFLAKADTFIIPGLSDDILRADDLRLSIVKNSGAGSATAMATISGSVALLEGFGGGIGGSINGNFTFDAAEGAYGVLNIDIGAGGFNFGPDDSLRIGANADIRLLLNATGAARDLTFAADSGSQTIPMSANSGSVWIDGEIHLGAVTIDGTFQLQVNDNGVVVFGEAKLRDNSLALLLGPQAQTGVDVTFAGGIQDVFKTVFLPSPRGPIPVIQRDGVAGAFVFDLEANVAIANAGAALSIGFNTSSISRTIDLAFDGIPAGSGLEPVALPSNLQPLLTLDPQSLRLFVQGDLALTATPFDFDVEGTFAAQLALSGGGTELDVLVDGTADLGLFGQADATAFLELGGASAAGFLDFSADRFGLRNLAEFTGDVRASFNTGRNVSIPAFVAPYVEGISVTDFSTYFDLRFNNTRLDLFDDVFSVGGSGSVRLSDTSGLQTRGNIGWRVALPSEITSPFGGLLPSQISGGSALPAASSELVPFASGDKTLHVSLGDAGAFTLVKNGSFGAVDLYGLLDVTAGGSAFGGLITSTASGSVRINTTGSSRTVSGRSLPANSFDLDLNGNVGIDPIPGGSNTDDDEITIEAGMRFESRPGSFRIEGTADLSAEILGLELVGVEAEADLLVLDGTVTGTFQGEFRLFGYAAVTGTAELTPSGCLDLPGLLPDGCGTMQVQLIGATVGEGQSGTIEVRLTDPVPQGSSVSVTLGESSVHLTLLDTQVVLTEGETSAFISVHAPFESASLEDFNNENVTVLITSAVLRRPFLFDEQLNGDKTAVVTITDPHDPLTVRVTPLRDGIDPDTGGTGRSLGFQFRLTRNGATFVNSVPIDITYQIRSSDTTASGTDFTAPSGTFTIPANLGFGNLFIPIVDDNIVEGTEQVAIQITGSSDPFIELPSLSDGRWAAEQIRDEDTALVSVDPLDDDAGESTFARLQNPGSFVVRLSRPSSTDTVVTYGNSPPFIFIDTVATPGEDFQTMPGSITIPAGQTSGTISLVPINDFVQEEDEYAIVSLSSITSGDPDIGIRQIPLISFSFNDYASILIKDNDGPLTPVLVLAGSSDSGSLTASAEPIATAVDDAAASHTESALSPTASQKRQTPQAASRAQRPSRVTAVQALGDGVFLRDRDRLAPWSFWRRFSSRPLFADSPILDDRLGLEKLGILDTEEEWALFEV